MKHALVYVSGIKLPFKVSFEEGERLQKVKAREGEYANVKKTDPEHISNIWHGEVGDLRFIEFPESAEEVQEKEEEVSTAEKEYFKNEIEPYCVKEDNDEYNESVKKYMSMLLDFNYVPMVTAFTLKRMGYIRDKYAESFTAFPEWIETKRGLQTEGESEEAFTERMSPIYKAERVAFAKEEMLVKTELVEADSRKLVDDRLVGWLTDKGALRFLRDKGAVELNEEGEIAKVTNASLYNNLDKKITVYQNEQNKERFVSDQTALSYETSVAHLAESMAF